MVVVVDDVDVVVDVLVVVVVGGFVVVVVELVVVVGRVVVVVDDVVDVEVVDVEVVDEVELVVPGTSGVLSSDGRVSTVASATPARSSATTTIAIHSQRLDLGAAPGTSGAVRSVQAWPSQ